MYMFGLETYLYGLPKNKEEPKKQDEMAELTDKLGLPPPSKLGWHDLVFYGGGLYFLGLPGLFLGHAGNEIYHRYRGGLNYPLKQISKKMEPEMKKMRENTKNLGRHYYNQIEEFMSSWNQKNN